MFLVVKFINISHVFCTYLDDVRRYVIVRIAHRLLQAVAFDGLCTEYNTKTLRPGKEYHTGMRVVYEASDTPWPQW